MRSFIRSSLAAALVWLSSPALACSMSGPRPTPELAFASAEAVVHVRVISQADASGPAIATFKVLKFLKGSMDGRRVQTLNGSMCGINGWTVGQEYVLFIPKPANTITQGFGLEPGVPTLMAYDQPMMSTKDILAALARKK